MAEDSSQLSKSLFDQIQVMKKKTAAMSLDYATYQTFLEGLKQLEQGGTKRLAELSQAARGKRRFAEASQLENDLQRFQKEIDDFRKFLKKKSPSS